jgi:hypothetical protein
MNTSLILARTEKIDLPIDSKNKPSCRLVCDEPTFVLWFLFDLVFKIYFLYQFFAFFKKYTYSTFLLSSTSLENLQIYIGFFCIYRDGSK